MREDTTPIKKIARDLIADLSKERSSKGDRVKRAWQKAVGKRFYPHTQPTSFQRRKLVVNVDSSGWLYELTMNRQKIASRLRKILKDDFKELQFRIGRIEK